MRLGGCYARFGAEFVHAFQLFLGCRFGRSVIFGQPKIAAESAEK